jgi:selenocysteine lyase/cysteine desulfurase
VPVGNTPSALRARRYSPRRVYLDLRAQGREHARAVLEEALDRLGLAAAYPRVMREAGGRDLLDLADRGAARAKVDVSDPARVASELGARGIDVDTRRGTGVRLSLHPCNLEAEVDRVLGELRRLA